MIDMAATLTSLSEVSRHLATVHKIGRNTEMSELYKDMQNMFDKWSYDTKRTSKTSYEYLQKYSYYGTLESNALREIQLIKENHTAQFSKAESALLKRKERLFRQDISKWELKHDHLLKSQELKTDKKLAFTYMLPKDTLEVKKLRDNHIFMTNQCYQEITKTMMYEKENHKTNFLTFAQTIR